MYTGSPIVGGVDRLLQRIEEDFAGGDLRWSYEEIDPDCLGKSWKLLRTARSTE
jgi:hypothetical protein